mgnify:CR=1 FL=1
MMEIGREDGSKFESKVRRRGSDGRAEEENKKGRQEQISGFTTSIEVFAIQFSPQNSYYLKRKKTFQKR